MMEAVEVAGAPVPFLADAERFEKERSGGEPPWAALLRSRGRAAFARLGLPSVHEEEWRYTNTAPLAGEGFRFPHASGSTPEAFLRKKTEAASLLRELDPLGFPAHSPHQLAFLNGRFDEGWSRRGALPRGVRLLSLADVLAHEPDLVAPYLGRAADPDRHPFTALNTAFLADGAVLVVPKGVVLEEPIHLLHVSSAIPEGGSAGPSPALVLPRTLVVLGEASQATVVETYLSRNGARVLVCPVTETHVGASAVLDHHVLQLEGSEASHVSVREIVQARNSQTVSRLFAFGARLARHEITLRLDGEGAHGALEGLFCLTGHQHADHHTLIEHTAPRASSQETYKGILDGEARGIFDGRIVVRPKAEKSDAHQVNRNLMLSSDARVDSKPQLEIYNNDVKCTHGSTTGRLSADALFYLRSRGLSETAARSLLTYAFASELVGRVKVPPLKTLLERHLLDWLPKTARGPESEATSR